MTRPRQVALAAGAILVAVGVLGFVPGMTAHLGELAFFGRGSRAKLAGLFQVSVLLNLVHALAGAALARTRAFLAAGSFFLALWLLGVVRLGGWVPLNPADNWLHLALAAALIGLARVEAR